MPSPSLPHRPAAAPSALPWPRWAEAVAILGAWTLFIAGAALVRAVADPVPVSWHTLAISAVEFLPWGLATPLVFWAARRVWLFSSGWPRAVGLHLVLAGAVVAGVTVGQSVGARALGPAPSFRAGAAERPEPPPDRGRPPGTSDLRRRPPSPDGGGLRAWSGNVLLYLTLLGVGVARAYAVREAARQVEAEQAAAARDRAEAEAARLAAQVAAAQLAALQMQIRPHFLFNALNAVSALAGDDPAEVRRIVATLSSLLRRVLDADSRPLVPLRDELAFLRDYLDLQRVRFDRLEVEESVDPAVLDLEVPALVLQPLVENAVEHGAATRGGGHVWIDARPTGDRLVLTVGDDGPGLGDDGATAAGHAGIGLRNTRDRLAAHYGDAASVALRPRPDGGAEAVVTLPLDDA